MMAGRCSKKKWNPRYTIYAERHGMAEEGVVIMSNDMTEEQMIDHDGGLMTEFSIWVWAKWAQEKHPGEKVSDLLLRLTTQDHDDFDAWLRGKRQDGKA